MLIPFDRNVLYVQKIPGRYLFSLLNDLFRYEKDISGYLFCAAPGLVGYLFFKNSKLLSATAFQFPGGAGMLQPISFRHFIEHEDIDIYANVVEEATILENLHRFFASACLLHAPVTVVDAGKCLAALSDDGFTGMAGFQQGMVMNMAFFDRGRFRYFLYYHPDTKSYAYENDQAVFNRYVELLPKLTPVLTTRDFRVKGTADGINDIVVSQQKDLIVNLLLGYFDIFDILLQMLNDRQPPAQVAQSVNLMFDQLREKYDPLYRNIGFSPDTRSVNWMDILDDRKYVPLQYRFEHYHLYIDEIWKRLLALLVAAGGDAAVTEIREKITKYLSLVDKDEREIKRMLYRLEQQCEKKG